MAKTAPIVAPAEVREKWIVDRRGIPRRLCLVRHKPNKECKRPHTVPGDALWSGEVAPSLKGELLEAARAARKRNRNSYRRWGRRLKFLNKKRQSTAAAFRSYVDKLIADHEAKEPRPEFSIDPERLS